MSLIERRAEFFENFIVSRLGEVVNSNGQGFGIPVGQKIRFGFEDLPDQSTGIVRPPPRRCFPPSALSLSAFHPVKG
ncbi:MAG: hypothetical protein DMG69_23420 [Acidobacteria bacterium]|nr:MAG: hypothetical protein DMG69_23420 [Acidobacteriota bacterium]